MQLNCLIALIILVLFSLGQCLKKKTSKLLLRDASHEFLLIRNAFYECPNPSIMDGSKMGVMDLQAALQYCVDDTKCSYFQWNQDTSSLYHCAGDDFTLAKPKINWIIGVKPEKLRVDGFQTTVNRQAVCGSELAKRQVSTLKEANEICKDISCSFLSINFNKASTTNGSSVPPMTAVFCDGMKSSAKRDGFLVMDRNKNVGDPKTTKTIKAPCGLSGPLCNDNYYKDYIKGDIVNAAVSTVAPPPVVK